MQPGTTPKDEANRLCKSCRHSRWAHLETPDLSEEEPFACAAEDNYGDCCECAGFEPDESFACLYQHPTEEWQCARVADADGWCREHGKCPTCGHVHEGASRLAGICVGCPCPEDRRPLPRPADT